MQLLSHWFDWLAEAGLQTNTRLASICARGLQPLKARVLFLLTRFDFQLVVISARLKQLRVDHLQ